MPEQILKSNLAKLREELGQQRQLDAETRQELAEIAATIERLLHAAEPNYGEAQASLEDAALRFEAGHPTFAKILSEVTDALAKLGI